MRRARDVTVPLRAIEFDLLCWIARPQPRLDRAQDLLRADFDFAALLRLATDHSVRPALVRALADLSWEGVPAEARVELERFQRLHLVRMLALADELCRTAARLSDRGIAFAAFKGATLAVGLHGDLTAREYNDIDLVVPERSMAAAEEVLGGLGYRGVQGDRAFRRAFLAYQRQFAFVRDDLDTTIDLHWAFSGSHLPFPLRPDDLLRDLAWVQVGRCMVPTASAPHLALLLAGHGTKEGWRCLGWVNDFAMIVHRHPELDWAATHRRAEVLGCGNAVLLGCLMAEGLLGVDIPPPLRSRIENNAPTRARAAFLIAHMRQGLPFPEELADLSDMDLCDSRWTKLRAVARLAVTRTVGDYEALRLPQPLWGAYRLLRPFRLAAKALGRLRWAVPTSR